MIKNISLEDLKVHPKNVRETYEGIDELAKSIEKNGVLQNLTVVPDKEEPGKYLVVIGNRRLKAAKIAGIDKLPCVVANLSERDQATTMITENMQRKGLKIYEEATAMQACLTDYGFDVGSLSDSTGLSRTTVKHKLNLAKLDRSLLRERSDDDEFQISLSNLYELERIKDVGKRNEILKLSRKSENIPWLVQSMLDKETEEKNYERLVSLAKANGIKEFPAEWKNPAYSSRWDKVFSTRIHKSGELAEVELPTGEGLYYYRNYGEFMVVKKAPKRTLSEAERALRKTRRDIRQLGDKYLSMMEELRTFLNGLGKDSVSETAETFATLWEILMTTKTGAGNYVVASGLVGRAVSYSWGDDVSTALRKSETMSPCAQMLLAAYWGCRNLQMTDDKGRYDENSGKILTKLHGIVSDLGFCFTDKESYEVMDGTHELYAKTEKA